MPSPSGRYWILTIPAHLFLPYLPSEAKYIVGQLEKGQDTGYVHWQIVVYFAKNVTLYALKKIFGDQIHAELSRSEAANDYCWKEESAIPNTRFELGVKSFKRNNKTDWQSALQAAKTGKFDEIPPDVLIRCYGNLKRIHVVRSKAYFRITSDRWLKRNVRTCFGVPPELESRVALGKKRPSMPILKAPQISGGVDTEDISMWSLMNFEDKLEFLTCFDGSTDILSPLKSKDPQWF